LVDRTKPDIILGCESKLDSNYTSTEVFPPGFEVFRKDRSSSGGGVFVAVTDSLLVTHECCLDVGAEIVWIKLQTTCSKPLYISSFYRPPSSGIDPLEALEQSLAAIPCRSLPNIILSGDINLPDINWESMTHTPSPQYGHSVNDKFIQVCQDSNLTQCVSQPTRGNNILDLFLTTNPDLVTHQEITEGISDHDAVLTEVNIKAKHTRKKPRNVYLFKKGNMDNVKEHLRLGYDKFSEIEQPVEGLWQSFKFVLFEAINAHIPTKEITGRWDIPWLTRDLKRFTRIKQKLYNRAKNTNDKVDWLKFKEFRKAVKAKMLKAHDDYIMDLIDTSPSKDTDGNNNVVYKAGSKFWKYIKAKKQQAVGVATLKSKDRLATTAADKAAVLNEQYQSVFTQEDRSNMPNLGPSNIPDIPKLEFSTVGIEHLLKSIDPRKANGPDLIPTRVLKECAEEIAPYLRIIYEQSFVTGEVPQDWTTANVTAIYKKGDRSTPSNYRPVSLTCVPCKLMEHIIYSHIMAHLNDHSILSDNQHGFRKNRSPDTQLIITTEKLSRALDQGIQSDVIILDFSKAFDKVPFKKLLLKLDHYGIRGNTNRWISSWIEHRSQTVVIDGEKSEPADVTSGVPQGSVLGPLMFLIYIDDISKNVDSELRLFADDSLLFRTVKSQQDHDDLQHDLDILVEWAKVWQMEFNPLKCAVLRVHRTKSPIQGSYSMLGMQLAEVTHHPYLGIELSDDLSWNLHINNVISKASRVLGFISRNLYRCPEQIKVQAYLTLVRPHLEYASSIWDPYTSTLIKKMEMVQRRAARFARGCYSREPGTVTALLQDLEWQSLEIRRKLNRLAIFYKATNNQIALNIPDYIRKPLRKSRQYHESKYTQLSTSTSYYQNSFFPRTIVDWNKLPANVIDAPGIPLFKLEAQKHLCPM
jgi:hypothetical protein